MKRTKLRVLQSFAVTAFLLGIALPQIATAQTPDAAKGTTAPAAAEKMEWLSITVVSVKPDMVAEFQKFVKNETNPALRKGGATRRDVWQQTGVSGNPFEFVIVAPVGNFAYYDGPSQLEKGAGKDGYAAWIVKAGTLVTSVHRFFIRTRPDLSNDVKRTGPPKLAVATTTIVAPGRGLEFENYLKSDYLPVIKRGDATYWVAQTLFGGDANEYHSLTLRETFTELDKGPVAVQVLGNEGAMALMQKLPVGVVVHVERTLMRYVPELSLMPEASPAK